MLNIAGRDIKDALVLSPMVDVTDAAFRSIAIEWGADVTCSEMVSAAGLSHGNEASWKHVEPWENEQPYGVQFMTGEGGEMRDAIETLVTRVRPDFIDVNLGCPAPNILRACAGGFLLNDPTRAGVVMRAAREAADDAGIKDVSVKMRTGPSAQNLTYVEVAKQAEDAGMSWVTLHGRTVEQGYRGFADWGTIKHLVEVCSLPVIGNGDIRTPDDLLKRREETGCAGFFIARAAMHDPTIFRRMRAALDGVAPGPPPALAERLDVAQEYLKRAASIDIINVGDLRRQVMRFVSGTPGAKRIRVALHDAQDAAAVEALVLSESQRAGGLISQD